MFQSWINQLSSSTGQDPYLVSVAVSLVLVIVSRMLWQMARAMVVGGPVPLSELAREILAALADVRRWQLGGGGTVLIPDKLSIAPVGGLDNARAIFAGPPPAVAVHNDLSRCERKLIYARAREVMARLKADEEADRKTKVLAAVKAARPAPEPIVCRGQEYRLDSAHSNSRE